MVPSPELEIKSLLGITLLTMMSALVGEGSPQSRMIETNSNEW